LQMKTVGLARPGNYFSEKKVPLYQQDRGNALGDPYQDRAAYSDQ